MSLGGCFGLAPALSHTLDIARMLQSTPSSSTGQDPVHALQGVNQNTAHGDNKEDPFTGSDLDHN